MKLADTGIVFATGMFSLLAVGVLIWGVVQLRQNGASLLSLGAILVSAGLAIAAFLMGLSGMTLMF
ncbi:hypothetical protein [Profundibacter amoris]|uniref:Uncharacterized protein n=1 Tax=Profundibacter amoris TaxID=2171755 RepID=A0A347UI73_9RHOB|nr:hypothetical protein [Profundibacter amoris]AXX98551.1 hypothetical protein BAR1_11840 [Profundibacter amoris]